MNISKRTKSTKKSFITSYENNHHTFFPNEETFFAKQSDFTFWKFSLKKSFHFHLFSWKTFRIFFSFLRRSKPISDPFQWRDIWRNDTSYKSAFPLERWHICRPLWKKIFKRTEINFDFFQVCSKNNFLLKPRIKYRFALQ